MSRPRSFTLLLGLPFLFAPNGAQGQTILVQVVEQESRNPIPTAFLALVDETGGILQRALTDPAGRYLFALRRTGTFRVRAEIFGRETRWSPELTIEGNQSAFHRFELPMEPIPLHEIRVESERRCRIRPADGRELARVWEEIQKALAIQEWMDDQRMYEFQMVSYERIMDRWVRKVESETHRKTVTLDQNPIRSIPARELVEGGFVRIRDDGSWDYFGPDASVLLSDPFLDTHCFRLKEDGDLPGWIGLAFEPSREEGRPDIKGTLWVDRETSHLGFLEWEFTNQPPPLNRGDASGRVEFERLPTGAWIIRRWWIRMPMLSRNIFSRGWAWTGTREQGGEITAISTAREGGPTPPP